MNLLQKKKNRNTDGNISNNNIHNSSNNGNNNNNVQYKNISHNNHINTTNAKINTNKNTNNYNTNNINTSNSASKTNRKYSNNSSKNKENTTNTNINNISNINNNINKPNLIINLETEKKISFDNHSKSLSVYLKILYFILENRTKYELMQEAYYIANLFFLMNKTNWDSSDDEYYILPTQWFIKWKAYTNFDYFIEKNNRQLEITANSTKEEVNFFKDSEDFIKEELLNYFETSYMTHNLGLYPGPVSTYSLLIERSSHLVDLDNSENILNYNIKDSFIEGQDFFIVTKNIWNYFKYVYGGLQIKRLNIQVSVGEFLIETKLKNVSVFKYKHITLYFLIYKLNINIYSDSYYFFQTQKLPPRQT